MLTLQDSVKFLIDLFLNIIGNMSSKAIFNSLHIDVVLERVCLRALRRYCEHAQYK